MNIHDIWIVILEDYENDSFYLYDYLTPFDRRVMEIIKSGLGFG